VAVGGGVIVGDGVIVGFCAAVADLVDVGTVSAAPTGVGEHACPLVNGCACTSPDRAKSVATSKKHVRERLMQATR
jgi:hypothetical protein